MNLRSKPIIAILALLALLAAAPVLADSDSGSDSDSDSGSDSDSDSGGGGGGKCKPGGNLKIQAVFVGAGLEIIGENFDVGNGPFEVSLAGIPLTVNSAGGTTINADLPGELPIPGQYLLEVSNGKKKGKCQYDEFDMNLAAAPDNCPCWDPEDLLSVTAENQLPGNSCFSNGGVTIIQNIEGSTPDVEGGFGVFPDSTCATRDFPPGPAVPVTAEEALSCESQIRDRCAAIGTPIP